MTHMKHIPFYKMQGTGNDFIVIDNRTPEMPLEKLIALTPELCHRKYGIGADGLLVLQLPRLENTDFEMIYRNADGSDAGMCGNGSRCLALLASELGLGTAPAFNVHENIYRSKVDGDNISIEFPFSAQVAEIQISDTNGTYYQVDTGTEHIVREANPKELKNIEQLREEGNRLRHHENFQPAGTNVNFFCGIRPKGLQLQTYERGVEDLTLACGTGAIASALSWHYIQRAGSSLNKMSVETAGGDLEVAFTYDGSNKEYSDIRLSGPAEIVFEGTYHV